jgi:GDP-L-fucose synthase
MLEKDAKIFVAGHHGLVGSAIWNNLKARGYENLVLNDVLQLFVIVGGTVGITFQIAWAIFKEIHNNKK